MPRHVILGAGPAGVNAIEAIRQFDTQGSITLVSDEPAYARMALPYFLAGEIPEAQLLTGSDGYFDGLRVERQIGRRAARVDVSVRQVVLDDGASLPFDNLLIATGSSPTSPPIAGAEGKHVHHLWTLPDTRALLASARVKRPTAVLVGAGFIGLIILNALHKLGWKLVLVEREGQILPRMLDRQGADAALAWLRSRGVGVYTGCNVDEIGGGRKPRVALSDGQNIDAHLVLLSTGIRPNLAFLADSGIAIDQGIIVDPRMQTNVPGIYAAGDVAQGPNLLGGPPSIQAIQTAAVDHGRIAGANMAGQARAYAGSLIMNILDVAELHATSFGRWQETADVNVVWNPGRPVYRKLVWEGTRLVGGIILGPVEDTTMLTDVGMLKGLIQSGIELGDWKTYLQERPWDLRRAYVASGAASRLLRNSTLGSASASRQFHFQDRSPRGAPNANHALLTGTRPPGFDELPRTPTPGIYKTQVEPGE